MALSPKLNVIKPTFSAPILLYIIQTRQQTVDRTNTTIKYPSQALLQPSICLQTTENSSPSTVARAPTRGRLPSSSRSLASNTISSIMTRRPVTPPNFPQGLFLVLTFDPVVQKEPAFTALNPNGRFPALVDHSNNNFVIWESGAIMLYLVGKYDTAHKISFADFDTTAIANQYLMFQMSGSSLPTPSSQSSPVMLTRVCFVPI